MSIMPSVPAPHVYCKKCARLFTRAEWQHGHDCEPRDTVADVLNRHGVRTTFTARGVRIVQDSRD